MKNLKLKLFPFSCIINKIQENNLKRKFASHKNFYRFTSIKVWVKKYLNKLKQNSNYIWRYFTLHFFPFLCDLIYCKHNIDFKYIDNIKKTILEFLR
jgi:hypothetical protein